MRTGRKKRQEVKGFEGMGVSFGKEIVVIGLESFKGNMDLERFQR